MGFVFSLSNLSIPLRRGQDKVPIMGRLSIIGYIVVKASGRMSSTVELIIQDSQGVCMSQMTVLIMQTIVFMHERLSPLILPRIK